ncbi:MAG: hypothetical protein AAF889_14400, partial [Cyanobacteria bacterium P01_D01_bin.73]
PSAQDWVTALDTAEARLTTCGVNDRHVYHHHLSRCPWCDRAKQFKGRDPFPSRDAVRKGEHRQPVRPKQKRPRTVVHGSPSLKLPLMGTNQLGGVPIPTLKQLPAPNTRLYWLAPGYSRKATIVSLVGLSACIIIPSLIILNRDRLNFATPGIPDRIPNSSASVPEFIPVPEPIQQAAIAQFPATQRQLVQLVDQTTFRLAKQLAERSKADESIPRNQLRQQVIATLRQLLNIPSTSADPFQGTKTGQTPVVLLSVGDRQRWVQGLYNYQASRRFNPTSPLPTTGQFDPRGQTRAALERDIQQALLATLGDRSSSIRGRNWLPNQQ